MASVIEKNLTSIEMDAEYNSRHFVFNFSKTVYKPNISASRLANLADLNRFNSAGDTLLEMFGIIKQDPIDDFYIKRGWVLENALKMQLKENGFDYIDYPDDVYNIYDIQKAHLFKVNSNDTYSGKPDIKVPKFKSIFECKSKSLSARKDIEKEVPIYELLQCELYLRLEQDEYDEGFMVYGFFSEELESRIKQATSYEELGRITIEDIGHGNILKMNTRKIRQDYIDNNINYPTIDEVMRKSKKVVDNFYETKTLKYEGLKRDYFLAIFNNRRLSKWY